MRRNVMALFCAVAALLLLGSSVAAAATNAASGAGATLFQSPIPTPKPTAPPPPPPPGACARYHVVRAGETLSSIGRLYGVSAWAIASANHLANPNRIYAGQYLCIPRGGTGYPPPPPPPPPACGQYHIVARGQTLYSIGRLYGVSPWVIASANGIYNVNRIYVGQRLFIPCRR